MKSYLKYLIVAGLLALGLTQSSYDNLKGLVIFYLITMCIALFIALVKYQKEPLENDTDN